MTSSPLSVLGKYQIIVEIGRGGFATVYRARDLDLSREVALKVLDPLLTRDPVWVARFRREARAVAGLDHPRIVTIYEIGQAEGALYIAMKLLEGGSLAQRLAQQGPLPWPEVVRIAGEIAEALDYAHGQGVLHRDLKPGNVLLDPRNGAVLTDFGFARLVADNSLSISMSGGLVGTPAYIAPEVWEGQDATAQTDIYALGCILYELVTGRTLFTGATPPAIMMSHFQPRAMPEAWPEGTPPGLSEVLGTALVRDPAARYARAGDLATAITALSVDPLAKPYAALEAAIGAGNWQPAQELAAEIRGQRNDYRDVIALEQRALAGVAQAAREQQAAQWRQAAEEALTVGRLEEAKLALVQWQSVRQDDPLLRAFRMRLDSASRIARAAAVEPVAATGGQSRHPLLIGALVGLLAVLALAAVLMLRTRSSQEPVSTPAMAPTVASGAIAAASPTDAQGVQPTLAAAPSETPTPIGPAPTASGVTTPSQSGTDGALPTSTPLPTFTSTPTPTLVPPTRVSPTSGGAVATSTATTRITPGAQGSVTVGLVSPSNDDSGGGNVTFQWTITGGSLSTNQALEVIIWKAGQDARDGRGMAEATRGNSATVDLAALDADPNFPLEPGEYLWGVRLVESGRSSRLVSEPRPFRFERVSPPSYPTEAP